MTYNDPDYIDPKDATRIRIHPDGSGSWLIDAANDQGYTEACWDSRMTGVDEHGLATWESIDSLEYAKGLANSFAGEHAPHLIDTKPEVIEVAYAKKVNPVRIRIYDPIEREPSDVSLTRTLRMAGLDFIYFHDDTPEALDTGWYLRPAYRWEEAWDATHGDNHDRLCYSAMALLSDEGENPEYDRAIGELLTETLGLPLGDGQPGRVVEAMRHVRDDIHP